MCVCVRVTGVCPRMSIVLLHSSPNGRTNDQGGGTHPPPLSRSLFFFPFFFLLAMLMRDELAYISRRRCRRRPSVRPSVSPRHEAGSFLSSLITCREVLKWPTRPVVVVRGHIRCRTTYTKKRKRKYGSLGLDAHKFRTPLVLRYMVLLHSTTPQTCTTLLACTCYYCYGEKDAVCFKSRMFCFFLQCRALTRDIRYTLPPSCPLVRRKDDAKLASSTVSYIPYLTRTSR